ncbi:MAG TPA: IclR family transcriptional regulator, partial [Thauera aminoaromatica]|nr:IclR family transcriptional regulator [Thauera aminoaromatica]
MQDIPNPSPSTARDAAESAAERRGIQSIEVGGSLLSALVREGKPMMLK